ncbi:MAG: hypothetical protein ACLSH1_04105 [Clostridia bacterium]
MAIQVEDLCYTYGEGTALERQALKHACKFWRSGTSEFWRSDRSLPDPAGKSDPGSSI